MDQLPHLASMAGRLAGYVIVASLVALFLKGIYNISPLHPLAKYPGPFFWRLSRLPASYHHATGDLYKCIAAIHDAYGPTARIAPDELSFTAPEAWIQIYNSRPQLEKSRFHFGGSDSQGFTESMITANDAEHMRLRRLANPAFLNSGVMEVEPVLQNYTDLLCFQLTKASSEGSHNMVDWLLWTLNDVIGHLALDQRFECLAKRRMHPWPSFLLGALKSIATINQFKRFGIPVQMLEPLMTQKMRDERDSFIKTATSAIDERLAKEETGQSKGGKPDIVGLMLRDLKGEKLSKPDITSNSVLIVGGGAETTSTCLSATIYHLCKTPRVMQKLKEQIRTTFASGDEVTLRATANMPYLKATIDETLRIFPVASFITPRMTPSQGHVINGEMIPGNTYVSMAQWHMGRSERFFDSAKEFRPERWLAEDGSEALRSPIDDILRPFSLGPRNCLGKLMALAEAKLVIAKLLFHFDMELEGDHATWVEDARFYILWQLQPLNVKFTPV